MAHLIGRSTRRFYSLKRASVIGISEGAIPSSHQSFLSALKARGAPDEGHLWVSTDGEEAVAFVGTGPTAPESDPSYAERIRQASARGYGLLKALKPDRIEMRALGNAAASAEGVTLASYSYDMKQKKEEEIKTINCIPADLNRDGAAWKVGEADASSQNFARLLADTPSNHMTPQRFCEIVKEEIGSNKIEVEVLDEAAIQAMGMGCFWGVAKGSQEPPRLLLLRYKGRADSGEWDLGLVGKGVTFDTGGICLKPSKGMWDMKHDMAGAAAVVAATIGAAKTNAQCNIVTAVPLCENMPGGRALKPGDVLKSLAGLSVEVEDTDAEGRLILADALAHVQTQFKPKHIIDVATLTGAMCVAVGPFASGVYASIDSLWSRIHAASEATGDLAWRMPLWSRYDELLRSRIADIKNLGGRDGGANSAARFLQRFLPEGQSWAHIDIAPVMTAAEYFGAKNRATGRPTRLLIDLARKINQAE